MEKEEYQELLKSQEFGIEFEFSFITRSRAREVLNNLFGHTGLLDDNGRQWEVHSDGSIEPRKRDSLGRVVEADSNYKVEVVSPLLGYDDIPLVQEVIRALRRAGAETSEKCGLHIHVSDQAHSAQSLRNLIRLFRQKEELFIEAFQIPDNRLRRYCDRVEEQLNEKLKNNKPTNFKSLFDLWANAGCGRYRMLNYQSIFHGKGIEFRLFNMSFHAGVVKAYIVFCLAISAKALTMQRAVSEKSDQHNNRFEFRNFLNRIGLSGDEYKNVRKHLLKHLSGDSSFADPVAHNRNYIQGR